MIACQKANCKNDFQIEFLYKIYDAAEILSWRNSKGYVIQIEIWQERKGLWHTVNSSREKAMSKVHMQYVTPIVYKALPFLFSINKTVWNVCLVHYSYCTKSWLNILTYKMMLYHARVSLLLPPVQCSRIHWLYSAVPGNIPWHHHIYGSVTATEISEYFAFFFISPPLSIKWQESKPLGICVFVCLKLLGGSLQNIKKFC